MTPYYSDGSVTIYHGDCRDVTSALTADTIIADPPYNVGVDYGPLTNDLRDDYASWTKEWFTAVRSVAWKTVVFPGHGNLGLWLNSFAPSAIGCWYKINGGRSTMLGFCQWEPWLYWCGDQGALGGSDVIHAAQAQPNGHPTPKPVDLMQSLLVKLRTDTVLDPFMGSGAVLVAAKNLGLNAIGIEIEERYCELAAERCGQGVLELVSA